jgi:zinc transport system permease protein
MEYLEFLLYGFIQKALIGGLFLGVTCAILGVFLVLKNMALIGDGLAHVTFGALALGLLLNLSPFWVALPIGILGSIVILFITKQTAAKADAAIGILSSMGIAGGVLIASVAGGFNVDLFSFLFGSILTIQETELILSIAASIGTLLIISLYYYDLLYVTFDEPSAKVAGINVTFIEYLLATLTGVIVVLSVKIVGVLLVSALIILPASTALQVSRSFSQTLIFTAILSGFSVISGIVISYALDLPSGALIVLLNGFLYLIVSSTKLVLK